MTDYSEAVIYGLYCKDKTVLEIYIGSARDRNKRKKEHKSDCNNENREHYNYKVYKFIRANGGWDNWIFKVIEEFPCEIEIQLVIRERDHYDLLNPLLNINRPYITEEEFKKYQTKYREEHIKAFKEYMKDYNAKNYQDNRDEILKKLNQKFTCECGKEYTYVHKKRHCGSKRHKKFIENNKLNTI
jgi:hypothetical protein